MDATGEALPRVPTHGSAVPAGLAPGRWRRRRRRELATVASRAAGPVRGQRARSAVLPRLSAMLIFGLGRPCPGISRHASRRPVCRPEPGGRRDRTAAARLPRSAQRTLPRPVALCLGLCLASAAATTPRGESPPHPLRPPTPPSQPGTRSVPPNPHPCPGSARAAPQPRESSPPAVVPGRTLETRLANEGQHRRRSGGRARAPPPAALTPYPSPTRT